MSIILRRGMQWLLLAFFMASVFAGLGWGAYSGWRYISSHAKPVPEPILVGIKNENGDDLTVLEMTPEEYNAWTKYGSEGVRLYRKGEKPD